MTDPSEVRPTVGHTVTFGSLQAYLEAYGAPVKGLKVRYEIAATPDGDAMLAADVPARAAGSPARLGPYRSGPAATCSAPC